MAVQEFITGIQHVGIPTADLEQTMAFYQSLGFERTGLFHNGENRCAFMRLGNLTIETWEGDPTNPTAGAINHISLNTTDVEKAFAAAKQQGLLKFNRFRHFGIRVFASLIFSVQITKPLSSVRS